MKRRNRIRAFIVCCFTAALLCKPALFPPAVKAQSELYEWLDAVSYTPEYDFSNTSLSFYAKEENISVSEEEYQTGLQTLADEYGAESPEAFEEQYGRNMVENSLIYDKVVALVTEQAVEI